MARSAASTTRPSGSTTRTCLYALPRRASPRPGVPTSGSWRRAQYPDPARAGLLALGRALTLDPAPDLEDERTCETRWKSRYQTSSPTAKAGASEPCATCRTAADRLRGERRRLPGPALRGEGGALEEGHLRLPQARAAAAPRDRPRARRRGAGALRMGIRFNHTLVHSRDKRKSAAFLADVLGLPAPKAFGHFMVVGLEGEASLDFVNAGGEPIYRQHYAFLIDEPDFDRIFGRIASAGSTTGRTRSSRSPARSTTTTAGAASTSRTPTATCSRSSRVRTGAASSQSLAPDRARTKLSGSAGVTSQGRPRSGSIQTKPSVREMYIWTIRAAGSTASRSRPRVHPHRRACPSRPRGEVLRCG